MADATTNNAEALRAAIRAAFFQCYVDGEQGRAFAITEETEKLVALASQPPAAVAGGDAVRNLVAAAERMVRADGGGARCEARGLLREALDAIAATPAPAVAQEPVAWVRFDGGQPVALNFERTWGCNTPLYTTPPAVAQDDARTVIAAAKAVKFDLYELTTPEMRAMFDGQKQIGVVQIETLRPFTDALKALATRPSAAPEPQTPQGGEDGLVMDDGPWSVSDVSDEKKNNGLLVCLDSDDFDHDTRLYISGDFINEQHAYVYAEWLAQTLNDAARTAAPSDTTEGA